MSERICYVSSTDRGDRLSGVRLVGARSDEVWHASGSADPISVMSDMSSAAGWITDRLGSAQKRQAEISVLCIDVEGANCTWLTSPSTDASVVAAAMAHSSSSESTRLSSSWSPPTLAEASVEALASDAPAGAASGKAMTLRRGKGMDKGAGSQRLAVLAVPDVSARLLLDALDDRNIGIERVISLWHGLAAAWDPAAAAQQGGDDVVASSAPVSAVVLVDPAGRLVWAWSRGGALLTAGTIRLPHDRHESEAGLVRIGRAEIGRLTTDWLSWSVQLGAAPARIVCVTPQTGVDGDEDDLTPAGIGTALGQSWPGATVDLAVHDDPIGATLSRLVDSRSGEADDARTTMTLLTHRPGRAHRSLYWWAAACLAVAAAGTAGLGWQAQRSAAEARNAAASVRGEIAELIHNTAAPVNRMQEELIRGSPRRYMEDQLNAKRQAANPGLDPPKPILAELETLSYVLGTSGIEIDEISLMSTSAIVYVRVPDTATGEMIKASLDSVADSHCEWVGQFTTTPRTGARRPGQAGQTGQTEQMQTYFLQGRWRGQPDARGVASTAGGRP